MTTPSPTAWQDKPVMTTAGRMDALEFAEDRLNSMRNVVRKMKEIGWHAVYPMPVRSLVFELTCMVESDDGQDAIDAADRKREAAKAARDAEADDDDDDTPLHDEAGHPVDSSCCHAGCSVTAVGWAEGKPYCAEHYRIM